MTHARLGALAASLISLLPFAAHAECPPDADWQFLVPPESETAAEGKAALAFAERANAALAGRHCITVRFDTATTALVAALAAGEATFAAVPVGVVADTSPALDVINLPFLFDSPHHALAWLETAPLPPSGEGALPLGVLLTGALQIAAPRGLQDPGAVAGLSLSAANWSAFTAETATALAASAQPVAAADLGSGAGADRGVIASWAEIDFGGLYLPPAVITETNHGITGAVILATPALADLAADDRAIIDTTLRQVLHEQSLLAFETAQISRQAIVEDGGTILPLQPTDRAAFRQALAPLYDAARTRIGAEAVDAAIAANAAAKPFQ